jgi:hypothetical protein
VDYDWVLTQGVACGKHFQGVDKISFTRFTISGMSSRLWVYIPLKYKHVPPGNSQTTYSVIF